MHKNDTILEAQHEAVRNTVGWYDWTHKVLEVTGADATTFLDKIYVNPIAKTKVGGAKYTTMLNEDGIIIDDVIVYRLEENRYWISTLYMKELIAWLDDHKGASEVEYNDITNITKMYAVQGPKSKDLANAFLAEKVDDQKFFTIRDNKIGKVPVKIARGGYSGEFGYEIYVAPENSGLLESELAKSGKAFGAMHITEIEVMVLTLASEKGYNLMSDLGGINPFEAGFDGAIDWSKDFIGKAALEKVKVGGPKRQLLGFTVKDDSAHIPAKDKGGYGAVVMFNGEEIGRVTKFAYGFTVGKNIGFALVEIEKAKVGDNVTINEYEATLTDRIWYDPENKKPFGR
jgi:aminomethyltransferase